jgi:hypothetical protein
MATTISAAPASAIATAANFADIQDVWVAYDEINDGVTVVPEQVVKGTTVRFQDPEGGKLRIVFLSPNGKETDLVLDSDLYQMEIGGTYHFKCFFAHQRDPVEISPRNGGILDVVPQRP